MVIEPQAFENIETTQPTSVEELNALQQSRHTSIDLALKETNTTLSTYDRESTKTFIAALLINVPAFFMYGATALSVAHPLVFAAVIAFDIGIALKKTYDNFTLASKIKTIANNPNLPAGEVKTLLSDLAQRASVRLTPKFSL